MSRTMYAFVREPRGELLRRLFAYLTPYASRLLMVVRPEYKLEQWGESLLAELQPHLQVTTLGSSWPGTMILDGHATILEFKPSPEVCDVVLSTCDRLYEWISPVLPEDLALVRADGTEILGSIAHERAAWLKMTAEEFVLLVEAVPEIAGMAVDARENPLQLNPPGEMDDDDLSSRP